ncbi:MAG: hypothetical protein Q8L78_05930 [Coxiellaceae bacterium]|nr:hypothetical protein [Coxiellaceae bacterium]
MRDSYLEMMDISVWRLRSIEKPSLLFYRLNNVHTETVGWLIAEDVNQSELLEKIAAALTPHFQKETIFSLDAAQCLILLGEHAQQHFLKVPVKTRVLTSTLSDAASYKKNLWEKLKPLRVLFNG